MAETLGHCIPGKLPAYLIMSGTHGVAAVSRAIEPGVNALSKKSRDRLLVGSELGIDG